MQAVTMDLENKSDKTCFCLKHLVYREGEPFLLTFLLLTFLLLAKAVSSFEIKWGGLCRMSHRYP